MIVEIVGKLKIAGIFTFKFIGFTILEMRKIHIFTFYYFSIFSCFSQNSSIPIASIKYYETQLKLSQDFSESIMDTSELKFSLWMNRDFNRSKLDKIDTIINVPFLEIQDNCFVALNCRYADPNLLYCVKFVESDYKQYFIRFSDNSWGVFSYKRDNLSESYYSKDLYMYSDIFYIKDISEYLFSGVVNIARNLCFVKNGVIQTFVKGKPIPYYKYYANWAAHKFHYIDGCFMPEVKNNKEKGK